MIAPTRVPVDVYPIGLGVHIDEICIILIREWRREENACVVNERKEGRHPVVDTRWWTKYTFWKKGKITLKVKTTPTHRRDTPITYKCVGGIICMFILKKWCPK